MTRQQEVQPMEERKGGNKAEQAAEALLAWIVAERLAPGDRIPREEELEEQLGVGRSTVREAVKLLASRNILEVRQGAGTFLSPKQVVTEDPLGFVLVQDKRKLAEDLLELRLILEPPIAALAAERALPEDCRQLNRWRQEVEGQIGRGENHLQADAAFHAEIARLSGNGAVSRLLPVITQSVELDGEVTEMRLGRETVETHREICRAIEEKNPRKAWEAMYLHLQLNRREMR